MGSQADNEFALDYLAGSSIRGAFISEYMKQNPDLVLHEDLQERRRWLEGGICFLNGYPKIAERRSWPFPICLYAPKDQLKLVKSNRKLDNPINNLDVMEMEGQMKRVSTSGFVTNLGTEGWYWFNTKMQAQLHINLRGEKTNLYRYEAIESNQQFTSVITIEEEDQTLIAFFRSFENRNIYLGGARSNGYGRCKVTGVRQISTNPEGIKSPQHFTNGYLYIYCLSDVIVRDDWGRLSSIVPESLLEKQLDVKAEYVESAVQSILVSGFNQKWGARMPKVQAIRKGSVLKYLLHGQVDLVKLEKMQEQGIGERRADGYGRIVMLPELNVDRLVLVDHVVTKQEKQDIANESVEPLFSEAMRRSIYKRIVKQRIQQQIVAYLLQLDKNTLDNQLSTSLLSKWMNMFRNVMNDTPEVGKNRIRQYIEDLNYRKNEYGEKRERLNKKAINALKQSKIGEESWLEFMKKIVNNSDNQDYLFKLIDLQWPEVSISRRDLFTNEEVYRMTMYMMGEYLRMRRKTKSSVSGKGR